ncbi:uncharacterized protein LY79DRAFT_566324 [Colletotrichum navitas]|uniref:Uncharacterized protein n=1 Tax=Colletotrichum navitas TaxID=681940 RepID=A0AAD8PQC9_9PEZI|nr:uncharacterized protein LY79DRAFT_566324 [Colletotrichum navitas]KAK1574321.1 hypothetical protein LY79DRAFT_566324 [Colletotrichum navitas]
MEAIENLQFMFNYQRRMEPLPCRWHNTVQEWSSQVPKEYISLLSRCGHKALAVPAYWCALIRHVKDVLGFANAGRTLTESLDYLGPNGSHNH